MVLVVTGSTGGIGSCIVEKAVKSLGIEKIYCMYRDEDKFRRQAFAGSRKVVPVRHDASRPDEILPFMQELGHVSFKRIVCIHTAFLIGPIQRAGDYLPDEIKRNAAVNMVDFVFLINGLLKIRHAQGMELKIINIDSGAAYQPLEGWGLYASSKAFANMFLKTVQLENPGVKVVSYEPGVVDTRMQEEIRNTDDAVCSRAAVFRKYYDEGMLRSPDAVAEDIFVRFVEGWDGGHFREGYQAE